MDLNYGDYEKKCWRKEFFEKNPRVVIVDNEPEIVLTVIDSDF